MPPSSFGLVSLTELVFVISEVHSPDALRDLPARRELPLGGGAEQGGVALVGQGETERHGRLAWREHAHALPHLGT